MKTAILGISAFYHDSAAALLVDGEPVAAAQEERFTRTRHDPAFPINACRYVLADAGVAYEDLAAIAFYEKPFLAEQLQQLGEARHRVYYPEHHLSHAASAFYPSPFDDAAILTIDGVGEWATTTIGRGRGAEIEVLSELHFPHSIGLL